MQALAEVKARADLTRGNPPFTVLIVTTKSAISVWEDHVKMFFPNAETFTVSGTPTPQDIAYWKDPDGPVFVIANWAQVRLRPELQKVTWDYCIADEAQCFPYETPVLTNRGWLPIGEIVERHLTVKVLSYDICKAALEWQDVTNHFRNPQGRLIKVTHACGEIICTPEHKVWAQDGYKAAGSLTSDDSVWMVPNLVQAQTINNEVLLSTMRDQSSNEQTVFAPEHQQEEHETARVDSVRVLSRADAIASMPREDKAVLRPFVQCEMDACSSSQSDAQRKVRREDASRLARSYIPREGRERHTDCSAVTSRRSNGLADGVSYRYESGKATLRVLARLLQSRLGRSQSQSSDRGRWPLTPLEEMEIPRPTQDSGIERSRVVRVEVYERTSSSEPESDSRRDFLYDIEVAKNHNYFADGVLVSNCIKNRKTQQTRALKKLKVKYRRALTGTPIINRPDDLWSILNWLWPRNYTSYWRFFAQYVDAIKHTQGYCTAPQCEEEGAYHQRAWVEIKGPKNVPRLRKELEPFMLRRLKKDVLKDLPDKYYCTPLETPILMADLSFKSIGDVVPGDVVMGWEEAQQRGQNRQLVPAKVISVGRKQGTLLKAHLKSGSSVRCTPDHIWRNGRWGSPMWTTLKPLREGKLPALSKLCDLPRELSPEEKKAALWLGGILDGEGSFHRMRQWSVFQSPKANPEVHARIKNVLDMLGIPYTQSVRPEGDNFRFPHNRDVALKILTWCEPVKNGELLHHLMSSGFTRDDVMSIEPEPGEHEVAWLETTTGNYVAWGYASKNSTIKVELPPKQRRIYKEMQKAMLAWVGEGENEPVPAPVAIAQLTRLRQFAAAYAQIDWVVDPDTGMRVPDKVTLMEPSVKLDALMDIIDGLGNEQIVVFSQFAQMVELACSRFTKAGIPFGKITGAVTGEARREAIESFQRGDTKVFISTIQAGGAGITLTRASTVAFLDRSWSPADNWQAEDRCHRHGQTNAVHCIIIQARDTVDEVIEDRLTLKKSWIRQILEGKKPAQ